MSDSPSGFDFSPGSSRSTTLAPEHLEGTTAQGVVGYAIESRDKAQLGDDLHWAAIRADQLITDRTCAPGDRLFVTAGFVYETSMELTIPAGDRGDSFARLRDNIRAACAGWSVGLLVTTDRATAADRLSVGASSIRALACSPATSITATPSHLFELTFSYVGTDSEVRSQSGYGSDALTSPVAAVAWLTYELGEQDRRLKPGDRVFTGGVTTAVPVEEGGSYRVVSSSLNTATDFLAW